MTTGERRQFVVLYRDFLHRMIDLDVLTARGEIHKLLVQFAAMLAAFNFVVALYQVQRFGLGGLTRAQLRAAAWNDEDFLIATTMAVAGLLVILSWNVLLPDRRDTLVLVPLPLRMRTIFLAKIAAIATALGIAIAAVNVFTGICHPFMLVESSGSLWQIARAFYAYWITMVSAGLFVLATMLIIQAVAAQFPPISSLLQLSSFFLILALYFLAPAFPSPRFFALLPSNWYLGLFQFLNGTSSPIFGPLAIRAFQSLIVAAPVVALSYAIAWRQSIRRVVEQPDQSPSKRFRVTWFASKILLPNSLDRAIVTFTARTISRSRQHRLLLAIYAGIGLAIALAYAKDLVYSPSTWHELNVPLLAGPLVLLFFAIIGTRAVVSLPIALPANWIFRIATVRDPWDYFSAVRKSLAVVAAVPFCLSAAIVYLTIWPVVPALENIALLTVVAILLVELSLHGFRKIPFTCSYLPGRANLHVRLGAYGIAFLFLADRGVAIEFWAMHRLGRFMVLLGILAFATVLARVRNKRFSASPMSAIHFEDLASQDLVILNVEQSQRIPQ